MVSNEEVTLIVRILCVVIIIFIVIYVALIFTKGKCSSGSLATLKGISANDKNYQEKLRDYYIKTSYNSCSTGQFQNDWVGLCALENVIKQGCRVLDFEIYQVDEKTVVATSNTTRVTEKGTYNYLTIDSVMKTIAEKAVSNSMTGDYCPNTNDPLFLHFRIKSGHVEVYDDIADAIKTHLNSKLLSNEYSYENNGKNLGSEVLSSLLGKVIIMVDKKENNNIRDTKMYELVNIIGNSAFLRSLPYNDIVHTPDMDELIDYNKKNMTFGYPDLSHEPKNYNLLTFNSYGVQMFAMCFQKKNALLDAYNDFFKDFAFRIKPPELRYSEVTAKEPNPINPDLSPGYKNYSTNYYNFDL
jgi:cell division protein FtsI/penicillin-binding protein 2